MFKHKQGQNLIEVILVIPLLLIIILGILEYALFQRNVNAVQDIAQEAAVAASKLYVDPNTCVGAAPPAYCTNPATAYDPAENPAVESARTLALNRVKALGASGITLNYDNPGTAFGQRPFALYKFDSNKTVEYKGETVPLISFDVDYRDPVYDGVSTQLIYHYSLVLFGLEFVIPGINQGRRITVIPRNIEISSTQTKQYVHY